MIFNDFLKALGQASSWPFLRIIGVSVALSIALLIGAIWILQILLPDQIWLPFVGQVDWLANWIANIAFWGMLVASIFLMMPIASLIIGFMLDPIARAVEQKHYPDLIQPNRRPILEQIAEAARFMLLLIALNLIAVVIYFTSNLLAPIVFWIINGILLGREYFQLVAMRRIGRTEASKLRGKFRFRIWFAGILMAIPLSVPLLNLVTPVIGVATFTHMFHRLRKQSD